MVLIEQIVGKMNSFLWDYLLIILLVGSGIYLTIRLKFIQIREFVYSVKHTLSGFSRKSKDNNTYKRRRGT